MGGAAALTTPSAGMPFSLAPDTLSDSTTRRSDPSDSILMSPPALHPRLHPVFPLPLEGFFGGFRILRGGFVVSDIAGLGRSPRLGRAAAVLKASERS